MDTGVFYGYSTTKQKVMIRICLLILAPCVTSYCQLQLHGAEIYLG